MSAATGRFIKANTSDAGEVQLFQRTSSGALQASTRGYRSHPAFVLTS